MAKIPLRDICDRLTSSEDLEGVVDALLSYLRALQGDWHPTLALYEPKRDALVRVWQRERGRLERRDVTVSVDDLPARLVRKFFRPSAFFNAVERRTLLSKVFRSSPVYEPDRFEGAQLQPLVAPVAWHSAVVLPLADQDDLLGLLVLVSPRRAAFPAPALEDVLAIRTMGALAMARRLHANGRPTPESQAAAEQARHATAQYQERVRQVESDSSALSEDNRLKAERMELLAREMDELRRAAHQKHEEFAQACDRLQALEQQSQMASQHLHDAYAQLAVAQTRLTDVQRTTTFLRDVFEATRAEHDDAAIAREMVARFCEHFEVERCSLMRADDSHLRIAAQQGMDPGIASRVSLPLGQGVAGWVAHHRKPVLVRERGDATPVAATAVDSYNSDSYVSVPLVLRDRLLGVLNLSNKRDGEAFNEMDLERAQFAGAVLSMALGSRTEVKARLEVR